MKIIKSIEDPKLVINILGESASIDNFWKWGLTDTGEIVAQSSLFLEPSDFTSTEDVEIDEWIPLEWVCNIPWNLAMMKRLIKEFDHLVIFT